MSHLVKPTNPALALWDERVDEMDLVLAASPLGPLIERLYGELEAHGLDFRPPCYVASEWGCPDGVPLIGLPFYLIDTRLHAYEEEHTDDLEDEERIMAGLRHEAGHAINYAYKLWEDKEWTAHFGDFFAEYGDDYRPRPFSRRYVRHLPGWYAQKHADEDFAETFAVWCTPGLDWRTEYAGWPVLAKLEYLDALMKKIGRTPTLVDMTKVEPPDADEVAFTVGELYEMRAEEDSPPVEDIGTRLDGDLRSIFAAEGVGSDATTLVRANQATIMNAVSAFAGSRMYVVKAILDTLGTRTRELRLRVAPGHDVTAMIRFTALIGTLTQLYLERGEVLPPDIDVPAEVEAE